MMMRKVRRVTKRLLNPIKPFYPTKLVLIHVGKCGGSTVRTELRRHKPPISIDHVHLTPPVYFQNIDYLIMARDPISRCVSAFSWRYRVVIEENRRSEWYAGEANILQKYGSMTALAEALYTGETLNKAAHRDAEKIQHIREDFTFYLEKFLKRCPPQQIKAVLMQETLADDIHRVFNITNTFRKNVSPAGERGNQLTPLAIANLRRYFQKDYAILSQLEAWDKIPRDTVKNFIQ